MIASFNNALLWQITKADNSQSAYLFGTIHLGHPSIRYHLQAVTSYLIQSQTLALEYDLSTTHVDASFHKLPDEKLLTDYLSSKKYRKLKKSIQKNFDIDLDYLLPIRPLFITGALTEKDPQYGALPPLDYQLWQLAETHQLHKTGLESWDQQMEILKRMPVENQISGLWEIGKNPSAFRKGIKKSLANYHRMNIRQLYKMARRTSGKMRKVLLFDRNEVMANRLAQLMTDQKVFAGIGAGHLWGKKGVLAHLKQKGFEVKPVQYHSTRP